ncbi:MAG: hypothetical protein M9918_26030, partial [Anaerolineae bacterium]|nr:hypothetical protein [Anaerolineae bacterium]
METKQKRNILIAATVLLLVAVTILLLPTAVEALPPDVRYRLPDAISQIGVTPVADDPLPAPSADTQADLSAAPALPGIDEAALQPTATNTPEPTATPVAVEVVEESAEPTATPLPPTETPTPAPTATPEPLPLTVLLEGLTNVPQTFNNCGPANLSIVLDYHGDETTQTDAAAYLKPNPNDR